MLGVWGGACVCQGLAPSSPGKGVAGVVQLEGR